VIGGHGHGFGFLEPKEGSLWGVVEGCFWLLADYRISRSLVVGLLVFTALPPDGSAIRLRDIARSVGVPQSTTLRYVNTLIAVGLVERAASGLGYQAA
jgi:hypothetical protein